MGNAFILFLLGVGLAFTTNMALDTFEENKELKNKLNKYEKEDNKEEVKEINING